MNAAKAATSGTAAMTAKVRLSPYWSASKPSTGVVRPPKLTARPRVTPDARPMRLGRYFWPRTMVGLKGM